jgi:PAS domain S-box-containing protein
MLYPERGEGGELRLLAFRGFNPEAARFWEWVRADSASSCGAALRSGSRVIVPDVDTSELMAGTDDLETYRQTGIRAVQTTPLLARSGKLLGMISTHWRDPHLPPASDLGLFDVLARQAADLIERATTDAALRDSEQRMRQFSDASPDIIWIRDAETLRYEFVSPAFDTLYGVDRARLSEDADLWLSLILPEDREQAVASLGRVARGESVVYEFRARRPSDGRVRVIRNTTFPLRDGTGRVQRIGGFGHDMTEQRTAEEQTKLLLLEVNHRAKNLLGVVQSIARQTAEDDPEKFVERFSARLAGLAASQELLVRSEWRGVEMEALVRSQLSHFRDLIGGRIRLEGSVLRLSPAAAQTVGMALHELAANAGKYGALSNDTGMVAVSWRRTNGPESPFRMAWHERGGPPVVPPARQGFGYTVMVSMVEHALDASVSLRDDPAGVSWEISAPAAAVFENAPAGAR